MLNFDSSRWYFWRFSWRTGQARLQVIRDSETGQTVYDHHHRHRFACLPPGTRISSTSACRPAAPGLIDATLPGGTYKNVYIGPNARPVFPAASK